MPGNIYVSTIVRKAKVRLHFQNPVRKSCLSQILGSWCATLLEFQCIVWNNLFLLVYEQAFDLATSEAQKSHVLAAMGMVMYISNHVDEAKAALCERWVFSPNINMSLELLCIFSRSCFSSLIFRLSSQLKPASDQGLLALSALSLITSDITMAAVALAELVKVGQKGSFSIWVVGKDFTNSDRVWLRLAKQVTKICFHFLRIYWIFRRWKFDCRGELSFCKFLCSSGKKKLKNAIFLVVLQIKYGLSLQCTRPMFQGNPQAGKVYIVKEIHRRPHSSLLWNNLAKFILRFQTNQLKVCAMFTQAFMTLDAACRRKNAFLFWNRRQEDVQMPLTNWETGMLRCDECRILGETIDFLNQRS